MVFQRGVVTIQYQMEIAGAKHYQRENIGTWHAKKVNKKPKILRTVIALELIAVIAACGIIYELWGRNVEARLFREAWSASALGGSAYISEQSATKVQSFLESVSEEMYEYSWTTEKIEYRTGADDSYKSAGTLSADKMVKHTGVTYNGWDRISVDGEDYYIEGGNLSNDIPDSLPIAGGAKGEYQKYALSLLPDFGWDESELAPLIYLWNRESGWNPRSHNKSSGAHGIPQALPASKMASEGSDYYTNPEPQIRWGLKYIARRYGSPSAAWSHFRSKGWY